MCSLLKVKVQKKKKKNFTGGNMRYPEGKQKSNKVLQLLYLDIIDTYVFSSLNYIRCFSSIMHYFKSASLYIRPKAGQTQKTGG